MENPLIQHYFKTIENNPLKFTNRILSLYFENGYTIRIDGEYVDDECLKSLIHIYNNHLQNIKFLNKDKSTIAIDGYLGDFSIFILTLYLFDIDDELLPLCLTNLSSLFHLIQEAFNDNVSNDLQSIYKINDMTEILIIQIVTQVRG